MQGFCLPYQHGIKGEPGQPGPRVSSHILRLSSYNFRKILTKLLFGIQGKPGKDGEDGQTVTRIN